MKTMKGILFAIFLGGISLVSQASMLTISPRYTNAYRFAAADAWNLDLQFTGPSNLRVYLTANISTAGKQVATLKSGEITLTPGAQSISATTISTAQLQYLNQGIADVEALTGTFPAGNYKVCYNAYCITPDCDGLGADAVYNETPECFELIVEPPTPLLLSMPEDKAELEYQRPTFNWIPPIPVSNVSGFNYLYTLVEKNKGQSCQDAIVRNRPVYKQSGIEQIVQPYPPEINDLDTGKSYCWKVDGLVGDIPVAQSEVWEFKVKGQEKKKLDTIRYVQLKLKLDASIINYASTENFYFVFKEAHNNVKLNLRIISDATQKEILPTVSKEEESATGKEGMTLISFGDNKYSINLGEYNFVPGIYIIQITDSYKRTYYQRIGINQ